MQAPAKHEYHVETIVAEYETSLLRYAARITNNPVTAQDVVQNVFIKLCRSGHVLSDPASSLKAWLYRVTHNEAVDHIRRESRLTALHTRHAEERQAGRDSDCDAVDAERRERVLACLRKLHPREQQVVLLRLDQGLSYKDISAVTGRTEGNVGNILHHAVRKLSAELKKERASA